MIIFWSIVFVLVFFGFGFLIPVGAFFISPFFNSNFVSLFFSSEILQVVKYSVYQALLSAAISTILGAGLGLLAHHFSGTTRHWSRYLYFLLLVPFALPSVVAAQGFLFWFGRQGVLTFLGFDISYSTAAVVVTHVFMNVSWVTYFTIQSRAQLSDEVYESALTMGARIHQRFWHLTLPSLRGVWLSLFIQIYGFSLMSFAVVLLLGGGPPVETLETQVYGFLRREGFSSSTAYSCAIWQIILTLLPWLVNLFVKTRDSGFLSKILTPKFSFETHSKIKEYCVVLLLLLPIIFFGVPAVHGLFNTVHSGFPTGLLLAVWTSLKIGVVSATLALLISVLGLVLATSFRSQWISVFFVLPAGVSTVVLGFGFYKAYGEYLDLFSGSIFTIGFIQAIVFTPFVYRTLSPQLSQGQREIVEATRSLGANFWQAFWAVEWPRWRPPVIGVWGLVFASSLGELSAASLFYNDERVPVSLFLSRLMGQYRFEEAQLVSSILFFISFTAMFFLFKVFVWKASD